MFRFDAHPLYFFDARVKRYRYKDTGAFAPREAILNLTKKYIDNESKKLVNLADELENGEITLLQFQLRASQQLKKIWVSQGILGAGGTDKMQSSDFLWIGRQLQKQYYSGLDPDTGKKYGIQHLADELRQGNLSKAKLKQRLNLYANSGQQAYWQMRRERSEFPYEVRVLKPGARHCDDCISFASLGVQKKGVLPLPAERCTCRVNCKCSLLQLTLEQAIERGLQV